MAKLSNTQQELLDAMQAGVTVHYMPYAGNWNPKAYFFRSDTMKRCTAAAEALIDKGYATKEGKYQHIKLVLVSAATNPETKPS